MQCGILTQDWEGLHWLILQISSWGDIFSFDSCMPWVAFPLLKYQVRVQEEAFECWSFEHLSFYETHSSTRQTKSPVIFTTSCYVDFFSCPWCSCLGVPAWIWDSSGGKFVTEISRQLLSCHTWMWSQCFQHLCPSYPSLYDFYCKSLIIIFQLSWPSIDYSRWLLCILVANPFWHWKEVSIVSTCSEAVLESPFS